MALSKCLVNLFVTFTPVMVVGNSEKSFGASTGSGSQRLVERQAGGCCVKPFSLDLLSLDRKLLVAVS